MRHDLRGRSRVKKYSEAVSNGFVGFVRAFALRRGAGAFSLGK